MPRKIVSRTEYGPPNLAGIPHEPARAEVPDGIGDEPPNGIVSIRDVMDAESP